MYLFPPWKVKSTRVCNVTCTHARLYSDTNKTIVRMNEYLFSLKKESFLAPRARIFHFFHFISNPILLYGLLSDNSSFQEIGLHLAAKLRWICAIGFSPLKTIENKGIFLKPLVTPAYSDLVWTGMCRSSLRNPYPCSGVILAEKGTHV